MTTHVPPPSISNISNADRNSANSSLVNSLVNGFSSIIVILSILLLLRYDDQVFFLSAFGLNVCYFARFCLVRCVSVTRAQYNQSKFFVDTKLWSVTAFTNKSWMMYSLKPYFTKMNRAFVEWKVEV